MEEMENIERLRKEIAVHESELADLRACLATAEAQQRQASPKLNWKWPLEEHEYQRYGRQMIVPNFGLDGLLPPLRQDEFEVE